MQKLNTIFLFVLLSFCLLVNVSYADIVADELYVSNSSAFSYSSSSGSLTLEGYSPRNIAGAVKNYIINGDDTTLKPILDDLSTKGYSKSAIYITMNGSVPMYCIDFFPSEFDFDFTYTDSNPSGVREYFGVYAPADSYYYHFWEDRNTYWGSTRTQITDSYAYMYDAFSTSGPDKSNHFIEFNNMSVKTVTYSSGYYIWDGETYYYKAPSSDEPETPTMPTNAEIASAVQMFYNSDLYKNNTNFKDFMVVYSFATGYYSFIGTDNHLLQEIYYEGAKPSNDDFTYPETWWRFYNYLGNIQNFFYGSNYWLYSTRKVDDVLSPINYDGVDKINNLFNLKFTAQNVIVYSSYEYEVHEYWPPESDYEIETGTNKQEITTIPGDQYTYDETLDPTDSEYSPIQNYIPINPSQTIISDVDVSEINKAFEENKNILNIENASWLFTANNKLISYFTGFLILLIVFLIISRVLGG